MALDVESVARLAANVVCLHFQARNQGREERAEFWSEEALQSAAAMRELLHVNITRDDRPDSVAEAFRGRLEGDASLFQKLEGAYPDLRFVQLLEVLAQKAVTLLTGQPPGKQPPEVVAVLERLRELLARARIDLPVVEVALFFNPRLAADVALTFEEALPFPWALLIELEAVSKSRALRQVLPYNATDTDEGQLIGLAFSGGGIRSATLNLGILQALAELKLSRYFDYLSTVSGGGYIGSWLHAWNSRVKDPEQVREALSPAESPDPESVATHPIKWLRQYSNYLAPRSGLFTADAWSIAAIWARNTLLNMIIIVLALAGLLMVPRGTMSVFDVVYRRSPWSWAGLLPLAAAVFIIQQNLHSFGNEHARRDRFRFQQKGIHLLVVLPVFLSSMLVAAWLFEVRSGRGLYLVGFRVAFAFLLLLCFLSIFGGYREHFFDFSSAPPGKNWGRTQFLLAVLIFNSISAALGGLVLIAVGRFFSLWTGDGAPWHELVWGPLAVCAAYSLVVILHLGLFGRNLPDDRREWWSRAGAVLSLWLAGWAIIAGTAVYGPWVVTKLTNYQLLDRQVGPLLTTLLGSGWLASTIAGVLKGRSDKTGGNGTNAGSELVARVAPLVFVAGLLLLISFVVQMGAIALFGFGFAGMNRMETGHYAFLSLLPPVDAWLAFVVCLVLALVLSSRVDINQFSMHNFYQNRLVRCYLGASHRRRQPNRFTGFDPQDDFTVADLAPPKYAGPYPIFNAALNLASGEELAWQERKAEAFSVTPLFSGFAATPTEELGRPKAKPGVTLHAYRPTSRYAVPKGGLSVGTAVAISGAAVSPNWGFHTAPATAFLLTVFNVRLGAWIGNPRHRKCWTRSGPFLGLGYLLVELIGAANNKSSYVYLSDGGHFENLGIYELVRRRCRYIVACDAGQDASFNFDDLGNAVRKCRSDFGVEIDIDLTSIRPKAGGESGGRASSGAHCAVGTIHYPDACRGTLIYIKASLTGDEPADVLEYAALHPEFPHQSTADQFFDESQFESYRRLGYHIGMSVFAEAAKRRLKKSGTATALDSDRPCFFSDLRQRWRAPSPNTAASFTRHAQALVSLMRRLRDEPDLEFLEAQVSPEWERLMAGATGSPREIAPEVLGLPPSVSERRAGFHFCNALLQLMEDVYLDLNLETEYAHPDNAGWMNLFRHWSWSAMFRVTWMISASCYGARFRSFCGDRLDVDPGSIARIQIAPALSIADPRVNYRERDLLNSPMFDWKQDRLYCLEIIVRRPDNTGGDLTELTVGVAVVSGDDRLAYFRIQDHLRNMGLARRMIDAMIVDEMCLVKPEAAWREGLEQLAEPVSKENKERVDRMLDSAHTRRANRNIVGG